MRLHRIYAIILRHVYLFRHSLDRLSDSFYWPTVNLLLWGLSAQYLRENPLLGNNIVIIFVGGTVLVNMIWRAQYEISVNALEEIWNRNLINLFASPLAFSEWLVACLLLGLLKGVVSISFGMFLAFFLYKVNLFIYGFHLVPFLALLILTGWWVGFLVTGLVLRYGSEVQTLAWTAVVVLSPFSGIYYPVSVLPSWAQSVAHFIPTSYVFEGARQVLYHGTLDYHNIVFAFVLSFIYLFLTLIFLKKSFAAVLQKGLIKVF